MRIKKYLNEEELKQAEVSKKVKAYFKSKGVKVKAKSLKGKTQWIQMWKSGDDEIPNDIRKAVAKKLTPDAKISDWDDVSYGNVRGNGIHLMKKDWIKFLGL